MESKQKREWLSIEIFWDDKTMPQDGKDLPFPQQWGMRRQIHSIFQNTVPDEVLGLVLQFSPWICKIFPPGSVRYFPLDLWDILASELNISSPHRHSQADLTLSFGDYTLLSWSGKYRGWGCCLLASTLVPDHKLGDHLGPLRCHHAKYRIQSVIKCAGLVFYHTLPNYLVLVLTRQIPGDSLRLLGLVFQAQSVKHRPSYSSAPTPRPGASLFSGNRRQ